ncbi:abortive infection bacteriophage resistance protein [Parabacteroides sp. PFB2-12]|uniref:Abi family protein n=1 Tax=unclassified Parabacteroides TaxID=2649774 RepID=UPI002473CF96|nr:MULTISPECIES: Abi family protein [unclassified Parabacteroides]MDH6342939.1 abortive infection bacteriophage resistance protein [Parabacteroides sp. PM6-13]MDH6391046.1 abortive infection bacteriophage resistance protein [Parabacteroides sp. PFB2-12]
MKYIKQPLSIQQQIDKLKSRGLIIDNEEIAAGYLSNISYYRLRAYTYPFQNNTDEEKDHHFTRSDIHFRDILDIISPQSDFKKNLISIIQDGGNLLKIKDMGFPENWAHLDVWKEI